MFCSMTGLQGWMVFVLCTISLSFWKIGLNIKMPCGHDLWRVMTLVLALCARKAASSHLLRGAQAVCSIVKLHTHTHSSWALSGFGVALKNPLQWKNATRGRLALTLTCGLLHIASLIIVYFQTLTNSHLSCLCFFITLSFCFCQCYPCSHPCSDWADALIPSGTRCCWMWRPQRTDVPMSSPTAWRAPSRRWCRCLGSWRRVDERRNFPPKFWCVLATKRLGRLGWAIVLGQCSCNQNLVTFGWLCEATGYRFRYRSDKRWWCAQSGWLGQLRSAICPENGSGYSHALPLCCCMWCMSLTLLSLASSDLAKSFELRKGLDVNIASAMASEPSDRTKILNSIRLPRAGTVFLE